MSLVTGETRKDSTTVLTQNAKGRSEPVDVKLTIEVPERIKLRLSKVEPGLFKALESVVGAEYFASYPFAARFKLDRPEHLKRIEERFPSLLGIGEHNPIITFHLQPNVRWHDGVPFTGADVKFTYDAIMNPKNASTRTGSFEPVKSLEVLDDLTVRVTYKRLYAQGIIDWEIGIVPKHLLDDAALAREADRRQLSAEARKNLSVRTTTFNQNPVGTGPFRFTRWLPDQFVQLTRNDQYWGPKALYEEAYFRSIPDYLAMELEFQAGALDSYLLLPHQAERYRRDPSYNVQVHNEGAYAYIGYNARLPLFKDVRVRQALGMALDVDSIIKYVLSGEARRSTGPFYAHTPYNDPTVKPLPYDPAGAARLLAEAGWHKNARGVLEKGGKPFRFTMITNNGNPQRKAIMQIAQEAWKKLGVECSIQTFEWTVFLEEFVHTQKFEAFVLGWGGGAINPDKFELFHSSQTALYETNYCGYESKEADDLLTKIRETYDEKELIALTHQFHRVIARDQPYTFIYEPLRTFVLDRRIERHRPLADGRVAVEPVRTPPSGDLFRFMSEWRKTSGTSQATAH
jgi:ABC-type transport system substrate-binding protein